MALRNGAIVIQNVYRTHNAVMKYRAQRKALLKLQFLARGYIVRARYQRVSRGIRCLQAQWRGSFCKRSYKNLKYQVVRAQSRVRGFLSRKHTSRYAAPRLPFCLRVLTITTSFLRRWKTSLFQESRRKVYDLWNRCDTPLLYRSKFWLTFNHSDFFAIGVSLPKFTAVL